jgi:hypothetical protein
MAGWGKNQRKFGIKGYCIVSGDKRVMKEALEGS